MKTVASLRGRLEQRAAEIQQLEDLLQQADARASGRVSIRMEGSRQVQCRA